MCKWLCWTLAKKNYIHRKTSYLKKHLTPEKQIILELIGMRTYDILIGRKYSLLEKNQML